MGIDRLVPSAHRKEEDLGRLGSLGDAEIGASLAPFALAVGESLDLGEESTIGILEGHRGTVAAIRAGARFPPIGPYLPGSYDEGRALGRLSFLSSFFLRLPRDRLVVQGEGPAVFYLE